MLKLLLEHKQIKHYFQKQQFLFSYKKLHFQQYICRGFKLVLWQMLIYNQDILF